MKEPIGPPPGYTERPISYDLSKQASTYPKGHEEKFKKLCFVLLFLLLLSSGINLILVWKIMKRTNNVPVKAAAKEPISSPKRQPKPPPPIRKGLKEKNIWFRQKEGNIDQ